MGSEATAEARVDAVVGNSEAYFDNSNGAKFFRTADEKCKPGSGRVLTEALVAGLEPNSSQYFLPRVLRPTPSLHIQAVLSFRLFRCC